MRTFVGLVSVSLLGACAGGVVSVDDGAFINECARYDEMAVPASESPIDLVALADRGGSRTGGGEWIDGSTAEVSVSVWPHDDVVWRITFNNDPACPERATRWWVDVDVAVATLDGRLGTEWMDRVDTQGGTVGTTVDGTDASRLLEALGVDGGANAKVGVALLWSDPWSGRVETNDADPSSDATVDLLEWTELPR